MENGKDFHTFSGGARNSTEHGIGFRIRIPSLDVTIDSLELNGRPLAVSGMNGYRAFPGNGFTQVQVNLDGGEAQKADDLFIVTCKYTTKVKRKIGWSPPQEVQRRLKK